MDDKLKRRMIGAAVLIVLGILVPVILVHMLSGDSLPEGQSVRVYDISPNGSTRPAGKEQPAATQAEAAGPQQGETGSAATAKESAPAPARVAPSLDNSAPDNAQASEQAASQPQPQPEPQPAPESKPKPKSPPQPKAADRPAPKGPPKAAQGANWLVQAGSFSNRDNAIALVKKLNAAYSAYYQESTVGGKTLYRVRLGPYASRNRARNVAAELHESGQAAQVMQVDQ